jgi:ribose-phosphate pyrophosphokinase
VFSELESRKYAAVVSPDAGAEKRASAFASRLHIPLIHAWKSRSVADGKISGFGHEPIPFGGKLLIVDDICDGGGTFVGLMDTLSCPLSDLFVTHGLFSKGPQIVTSAFGNVFCTDSITLAHDGVRRLEACEQLVRENS